MKINVALFGLGRIGAMHAQNIKKNNKFNLKYVYDVNKKLSLNVSKKLKTINIKNPYIAFKDKSIKVIFIFHLYKVCKIIFIHGMVVIVAR